MNKFVSASFAINLNVGANCNRNSGDLAVQNFSVQHAMRDNNNFFKVKQTFSFQREKRVGEVDCLAAGLAATGIKKGDRVGMWGPNSREWILTQYACARVGAILVNVNPAYRVEETVYALRLVGMKAIVAPRAFKTQDYYSMLREICPELETTKPGNLRSERLPDLRTVVIAGNENLKGAFNFDDVMDMGHDTRHDIENLGRDLQFDEAINIQFTSGTVVSCPLPLNHTAGMIYGSLSAVVNGATCVFPFPSPTFEPRALLKSVQDEKCTTFIGVPTMYIDTLNHLYFDKYDTSSLRICTIVASPCPEEVFKLLQSKLNITPLVAYGMTESGPVAACANRGDTPEIASTTVGKPFDHVEVAKFPDGGKPRSTTEAMGYRKGGNSRDLGKMDEKGNVSIVGRIKDIIIRGGVNIFPVEIEDFLYQHPKVETVQIVGVPDVRMGEEVCACIRLKRGETSTAEEIKAFCKRKISHFKIPRYVEFVESFPMTATSKVKKFALRDIMAKKLGLPGK
ncbi:Acyl-CoA synthetase family member 2, mitochondrial [Holothuria leucospilota]|uniref:Medium-chain acyl-CoA ligase ACSF2, mitochondrial n=1 Tax=Holothuria leucospilota TaxID=206669 RepID=A0A9Q0YQK6_HOLLE|nr:Acyl-CoA synthetase family member 2, mitochondrial [Holothuria leucospilota]